MATTSPFFPYKIVEQGRSTLTLASPTAKNIQLWLIRAVPLFTFGVALIVFLFTKEAIILYIFAGFALVEFLIFSFAKIPVGVQLDSMGMNLETVSTKGFQQTYYLWNDVAYIRYYTLRTKNGTMLMYHAIAKSGDKVKLLSFTNYNPQKTSLEEINFTLSAISKKEVRQKN